jgi:uncharacterized protein
MQQVRICPYGVIFLASLSAAAPTLASADTQNEAAIARSRGDCTTALRLYRLLADQGNADAQVTIGVMHSRGECVAKDQRESHRWGMLAAKQGHPHAMSNVGLDFWKGHGVAQDNVRALMWFTLAEELGDGDARIFKPNVAAAMSAEELAATARMTAQCRSSHYQVCD